MTTITNGPRLNTKTVHLVCLSCLSKLVSLVVIGLSLFPVKSRHCPHWLCLQGAYVTSTLITMRVRFPEARSQRENLGGGAERYDMSEQVDNFFRSYIPFKGKRIKSGGSPENL